MQVIEHPKTMQALSEKLRKEGKILGLVPTMGALHEGHLSLLRRCRAENDLSIMSLFVNPAQFDQKDDLAAYPRDFEGDLKKAEEVGVDITYAPTAGMMYPEGYQTFVGVEALTRRWEGASRPGHFRGVATVVAKLFTIVKPHRAYFGQKDYQQALVVQRMVQDLNFDLEVIVLPTIREMDGLAFSSRNWNLSPEERRAAPVLFKALQEADRRVRAGEQEAKVILDRMREIIEAEPLAKIDYITCCHPLTLEPVERISESVVFLLAIWIGRIRLIDNILLEAPLQT